MAVVRRRVWLEYREGDCERDIIPTRLLYTNHDPYAVTLKLQGITMVTWEVGRDLLLEGLETDVDTDPLPPRLDFSVGVCYSCRPEASGWIHIVLGQPEAGYMVLHGDIQEFREFLLDSYDLVPAGAESQYYDLDDTINKLLSS